MGVLDFLRRKKEEEDIPDFGPASDFGSEPFPPAPTAPGMAPTPPATPALPPPVDPFAPAAQSYPLSTTPSFPTPASVGPTPAAPAAQSDVSRELEKINHKLDLISERISKMEQTLDFMQRYTYANR